MVFATNIGPGCSKITCYGQSLHFILVINDEGNFFINFDCSSTNEKVVDESVGDENVALKSQVDDLLRVKEELERLLLVQAGSVKQYDVYCQSLVRQKH